MKFLMLASGLVPMLTLALSGCGQPASQQNATAQAQAPAPAQAPAKPTVDYLARINALAPKQRDVVFYRALDDSGSDCQAVSSSEPRAPVEGHPAWTAHCEDGRAWVVILQDSGLLQIATPEGLDRATGNKTAP
ncbi:hypothetical protein MGWOODY_Smn2008 [hydrothermal vent metagenome]|jgi:hypothetical protein|uniref:Lipoprotein n=1 Tax=hydrothermal vent metagenome TaxID=652676 RepID=A0A160TMG3_9ZZZZ